MKSIKKKMKTVEERVERLKGLADRITSFQEYRISRDTRDTIV